MLFGVHLSRSVHAMPCSKRARLNGLFAFIVILNVVSASPALAQRSSNGDGDHNKKNECPPETSRPPQNCDDVRRIAYRNALRRGYANTNGNGVPDVMERAYQVGFNDCSTGNAHMACMFNDECTEQHGKLLGMRSQSAWHATTMYKGNNGQQFECDFTPGSSGIFIANRADTRIGPAFPDAGESIDPQYARDGCETNGANTSSLNGGGGIFGGGGGGGSMQDMMMMMAIMRLLQGQQNQDNQQSPTDGQPASNEVIIPTPTMTPTPSPVPTRTSGGRGASSNSSTQISDADIVSTDDDDVREGSSDDQGSASGDTIDDEVAAAETPRTAAWELKREGMF